MHIVYLKVVEVGGLSGRLRDLEGYTIGERIVCVLEYCWISFSLFFSKDTHPESLFGSIRDFYGFSF